MSDRQQNNTSSTQSAGQSERDNSGNLGRGYGDGGAGPYGSLTQGASDEAEGGFGGDSVGGYGQQGLNSQAGQGGSAPITQGASYGRGDGQFGPADQDSQSAQTPYRAEPDHKGGHESQDTRSGAQPDSGGEGSYAQQDYSPAAQRSKLHQDQNFTGLGANPPLAAAADGHAGDGPHDPTAPTAHNKDKPTGR